MQRPVKVALVFPGAVDGIGGAEVQALHFLTRCDPAVIEARLVLLGNNPAFEKRASEVGFAAIDILNRRNRHLWHPAVVSEYVALLRTRAFDLVHLYGLRQEIVTRPATRFIGGIKTISAIRGMESHRGFLHVALNRLTARWVDLWISNSEETRELFVARDGLSPNQIDVVANGVAVPARDDLLRQRSETRRELGVGDNDRIVICVANHLREKRIPDLVAAIGRLEIDGGRCLLVVAGRFADDSKEIEAMSKLFAGRVTLLGFRNDVPRLLAAADVMALVSEKEGMPSSVLEGMAAALPVVVTPVASLVRMVRSGENGFIVPVGDVDAIVDRLAVVLHDPCLAASMGERSRQIVIEDYSIEAAVRKLTGIYLSLTGGTRP